MKTIGISAALGVLLIWAAFGWVIFQRFGFEGQGAFGDTYGILNTLFSGLAMAGVIVAIFMQRQELIYQREELTLTRKELARGTAAQETSSAALNKQFQMLNLTARINAYSFQIGYLRQRLNDGIGGDTAQAARESIVDLSGRLDVALAEIENMG